jgi:hypothetical protein
VERKMRYKIRMIKTTAIGIIILLIIGGFGTSLQVDDSRSINTNESFTIGLISSRKNNDEIIYPHPYFYCFVFALIIGEYETKKRDMGFLILESEKDTIIGTGLGILKYGGSIYSFDFCKRSSSYLGIKCFLGICRNGKILGLGFIVFI